MQKCISLHTNTNSCVDILGYIFDMAWTNGRISLDEENGHVMFVWRGEGRSQIELTRRHHLIIMHQRLKLMSVVLLASVREIDEWTVWIGCFVRLFRLRWVLVLMPCIVERETEHRCSPTTVWAFYLHSITN